MYKIFDNGIYEGEIKDNKREGQGIMYFNNGNRYEGGFINNMPEGKGTYFINGDWYVGDFKDGKR